MATMESSMILSDRTELRIGYAGDRDVAVRVLEFIIGQGVSPITLLVPTPSRATHVSELLSLCSYLDPSTILVGPAFREPRGIELLQRLKLDYVICVHFPYIFPWPVLEIPRHGVLNLHPAFLPYNRGWHTPSWAILEGTPYGASLHFMSEEVDIGDIVHQRELKVSPNDTAHSLYQRVKELEFQVFCEAWPALVSGTYVRRPQDPESGAIHRGKDLFAPSVQEIRLDTQVRAGELIDRLRALTTNRLDEAAYFEINGKRYRIQVTIVEEEGTP